MTYNQIREDIMNMKLEPGVDVSAQKLSDRYGVSRTPVREAVVRLQQSGLVKIYPQSKTVVSKIDLERVREEWFIRTSLEIAVVDNFIHKCSELVADTLQELINKQKRYLEKEYFREFYIKDNRFHQLIFETAGEPLAYQTIENVVSHYNRIRLLYHKIEGVAPSVIDEHQRIVDATRKRDVTKMREVVREHSYHLIQQVKCMSEQYPEFFEGNASNWEKEFHSTFRG